MKEVLVEVEMSRNIIRFQSDPSKSDKQIVMRQLLDLVPESNYLQSLITPDTLFILQMHNKQFDCMVDVHSFDTIPHEARLRVTLPNYTHESEDSHNYQDEPVHSRENRSLPLSMEERPMNHSGRAAEPASFSQVMSNQMMPMQSQRDFMDRDLGGAIGPQANTLDGSRYGRGVANSFANSRLGGSSELGFSNNHGMDSRGLSSTFHDGGWAGDFVQPWYHKLISEEKTFNFSQKESNGVRNIFKAAAEIKTKDPLLLLDEICKSRQWTKPGYAEVKDWKEDAGVTANVFKFRVRINGSCCTAHRYSKDKRQARIYAALRALHGMKTFGKNVWAR